MRLYHPQSAGGPLVSAATEPSQERGNVPAVRIHERRLMRRALPVGPSTQFLPGPDREVEVPAWPSDDPITPVVLLFMDGEPFEIDGDSYHVERVLASNRGSQADLLILRGHEFMRCEERETLRAIQVRDLEDLVDQDRVELMFGANARRLNLDCGWCRGGRTLTSLGFDVRGASK